MVCIGVTFIHWGTWVLGLVCGLILITYEFHCSWWKDLGPTKVGCIWNLSLIEIRTNQTHARTQGHRPKSNVVCFNSFSCSLPYINNPPYLCFPFIDRWYAYSRYRIRCGSYFFTIVVKVFSIRAFIVIGEMCSSVCTRVRPLYITSPWLSYSWFKFSYFGCTDGI